MISDKKDFVKKNWGSLTLDEICKHLSINLYQLLEISYELNLHRKKTPDVKRRWTEEEDRFLKEYSNRINIREACNLLYRSRYATYQRIKFLNLYEMVGK
ncbi:hypothetical protein [Bacillus sp. BP-3]|uniref:hypothetical protein n=1 Tax=Bacillus sp. BP-3 TaxID=3022773 RepID=UPI0023303D0B|nr:hypothetical protein [Bacillus sp. BP-3]MDC2863501.1 hypothetical protein [Bacillus sp. BP-3]